MGLVMLLQLFLLMALAFICIHGELDSNGFIAIDCGYSGPKYKDINTKITYVSDENFTDAGSTHTVEKLNMQPALADRYLNQRYYATSHLSEKSDVYSFGVVVLVLITAQPAIITFNDRERISIALWAPGRLSEGDIESMTDPSIRGDCDVNSVWKVAGLALQCTEHVGRDRPTMAEVVEGISESLQLETSSRSMRCSSTGTGGSAFAYGDSVPALELLITYTSKNMTYMHIPGAMTAAEKVISMIRDDDL